MTSNRGRSIVFYPRSYNTRGEAKKHSMIGVTSSGELINVKLRLDSKHEDKENAPAIKEFAKTDYFAKTPCIASDNNGPDNAEGILLLSRCTKDGFDHDKGADVYTARWAVVISPSSKSREPIFGLGRMAIKKDSPTVKKLTGLMRKSEHDNRAKDADAFKAQIEDPKSWSYPAIFYYPEMMISFASGSYGDLMSKGVEAINSLTKSGIAGGFAIRARTKSNEVIKKSYREIFVRFVISEGRYQNGDEAVASLIDVLEENHSYSDCRWDAIPIKRVNTGPASSRHYGSEEKLGFTRSMFTFENDAEPRLAKCCARVSYFSDTDNTLLSRLYTLSEPLDHPARLDKSGHFSLTFEGEGTKLAHLPQETDEIKEIPDSISKDQRMLKRALWLLEGDIPILRAQDESSQSPLQEAEKEEQPGDFEETDNESESIQVVASPRMPEDFATSTGDRVEDQGEDSLSDAVGDVGSQGLDAGSDKQHSPLEDSDVFEVDLVPIESSNSEIESKLFKESRIVGKKDDTADDKSAPLDSTDERLDDGKAWSAASAQNNPKSESVKTSEPGPTAQNPTKDHTEQNSPPKEPLKGMAASILKKRKS